MSADPPLVIDLDGTLLRSDLLIEGALLFARGHPFRIFAPLRWLASGKASLKKGLAGATSLNVSTLPYDGTVLELIHRERFKGRRVVLATASYVSLANDVARHLGVFDEVVATEESNLSAEAKRDRLVHLFGNRGFDYVGNARADLHIWEAARKSYVVNASKAVERDAKALGNVAEVLRSPTATVRDWGRALRVHQWLKNLLLFVPLLAAHRYVEMLLISQALLAFLCFCLCASSVYVLNDLLDLQDDRLHPIKRTRPFASGRLPIQAGLAVFPLLLAAAFALGLLFLPRAFVAMLATYYVLTLTYSIWLKRRIVIDVITLAMLYTLRVIAGAVALGIALSFWLLAFSMFMFLSLALVKRYAELYQVRTCGDNGKAHGRGYIADDLEMVASLGASSGYIAVMVLALYVNDAHVAQLYRQQEFIWLACPLLLTWISRVWMLAHRGEMNEDPVVFAVRDRVSLLLGALVGLAFWVAK